MAQPPATARRRYRRNLKKTMKQNGQQLYDHILRMTFWAEAQDSSTDSDSTSQEESESEDDGRLSVKSRELLTGWRSGLQSRAKSRPMTVKSEPSVVSVALPQVPTPDESEDEGSDTSAPSAKPRSPVRTRELPVLVPPPFSLLLCSWSCVVVLP